MKVIQYRALLVFDPNNGENDDFRFVTVVARDQTSGIVKAVRQAARLCVQGQKVGAVEFWAVLS